MTRPRITPREWRLRTRIDELREQRDTLAEEANQLRAENDRLLALVATIKQNPRHVRLHMNQYGPCAVYNTPKERRAARRRSWRESKRRKGKP